MSSSLERAMDMSEREPTEQAVESEFESEPIEGRRRGPLLPILIVALAIGIGVFLVPDDEPAKDEPPPAATQAPAAPPTAASSEPPPAAVQPAQSATEAPPAGAPAAQASGTAAEPATPAPVDTSPGARARSLIADLRQRAQPDLDAAYRKAQEFAAAGAPVDAYLLHFYAARLGHGASAMTLAEQADPTRTAERPVLGGADAGQAIKWYQVAQGAGVGEARSRLGLLKTYLEEAAAAGDLSAERLLLQWQ